MISKHNSIRWNEVLGDPFSRNLSPLMLVGDGVTHTKLSRTPGTANKVAHDITYDRDYVMAWLTKKFIQGLQIKDKNDAIAIISEVWDYYEKLGLEGWTMNSFLNKVRKLVQFRSQVTSVAEILNRLKISQSQREIQKVENALRDLGWTCVDSVTNAWLPPGINPKVEALPKEEKEQESESENYILPAHLQDWLKSGVNKELASLNILSISGDSAYERLLYGLDGNARRNDGRLRDYYLNKYKHLEYGGWWCSGIDVLTGKDSDWGCFKPDRPRTPHQKNKPQKYEQPESVSAEIFALRVNDAVWEKISDRYGVERSGNSFWDWVRANPQLPIVITEGAKKAGSLLCAGHVAIALPGINNGCRNNGVAPELIPQLRHFCQRWREFVFAFDQDKKYKTRKNVTHALLTTGKLLKAETCQVSILEWRPERGKGIDDAIVSQGSEFLEGLLENRIGLEDYEQSRKERAPRLDAAELIEFCEGEFEDRLAYDELKGEVLLDGNPFDLANTTKVWFINTFGYQCGKEDLLDTLLFLAQQKSFNPVVQYLNSVRQSATRVSIDNLATRYFGTNNPLYDLFVKVWLIGAVARALNPGCQLDYVLVLYGKQRIGKSSFFRGLGGPWFDDSIDDISKDDALLILNRSWIQELAELERIVSKTAAGKVKVFITRRNDVFRKKYDREASEHPRRSALCASVNKTDFLVDETGNTRFLVVPISEAKGRLDLILLSNERDGIWASALDAYLAGEQWELTPEQEFLSELNNKRFQSHDEWQSAIENYLEGREFVSIAEILVEVFDIENGKHDTNLQKRVAGILRNLGWENKDAKKHRGIRQRVWCKMLQTSNMAFFDRF
ncbi:MAG: DUF3854 domain-containing protein [Hydrococcus sp. RU_2_2]|nr:DUF3854 domain-containing protein [Hydrococcus sp. RU_2_2]